MKEADEATEAWPLEQDLMTQRVAPEPVVKMTALHMGVHEDFIDAPVAFVRRGVQVDVTTPDGRIPYSKRVWQRGVYLPFRPFYEKRLERAKEKAVKIAGSLALEHS